MSNGTLAVREPTSNTLATLPPEIVEKLVIGGDLKRLDPAQRLTYYKARCDAAGLDVRTRPFEYLELQGKLTLYATKACTDNLTAIHGLTVQLVRHGRQEELGIYMAEARASFPSGRYTDDIGVTPVHGLRPADLCNAMMKAVTKAKRRAVLSACGLGDVIDESEIETVPGREHLAANNNNDSGYGSGAYAHPDDQEKFRGILTAFVEDVNAKWLDKWTTPTGEVAEGVKDLLRVEQVANHIVKWAAAEGMINAPEAGCKPRQRFGFAALAWLRNPNAVMNEARSYGLARWKEERQRLEATEPEDQSQEVDATETEDFPEPGSEG